MTLTGICDETGDGFDTLMYAVLYGVVVRLNYNIYPTLIDFCPFQHFPPAASGSLDKMD